MKCIYALFLFLTVSSYLYGKTNFGRFGMRERDSEPDSLRLATNIIRVNGIVVDEKGVPIPGAHIVEKGTYHGVVSDKEGQFSLSVPADGELVISFVGYKTLFIPIQGKAFLRVHLEEDMIFLKDVVVTALGIEKSRRFLALLCYANWTGRIDKDKRSQFIRGLNGKSCRIADS